MKKSNFLKALLLFLLTVITMIVYPAVITSTSAGGTWSASSTWIGGYVPGPYDDVIINGPVSSDNGECNNITISATGSIKNFGDYDTLYVLGNITNNGIVDYYYHFILNIRGDLTNNGVWQAAVYTYLTGNAAHHITTLNNNSLQMYQLENTGSGNVYIDTFAGFDNVVIKMNNDTLFIADNATFEMKQQHLDDCVIIGEGNTSVVKGVDVNGSGPGFNSVSFKNISFQGIIDIGSDFTTHGTIVNDGIIQNYWVTQTLTIADGVFINNGTFRNYNQWLNVDLYANFVNYGTVSNKYFVLKGAEEQYLSQGDTNFFSCSSFQSYKPAGKIHFISDIAFKNSSINLQGDTVLIPDGIELELLSTNVSNAVIDCETTGGLAKLYLKNNSNLSNCSISNTDFLGIANLAANDLYGEILITDTLQDPFGGSVVNIHGNITNNGLVRTNSYGLTLNVEGDIANNGIWQNTTTKMVGAVDQHIDFSAGNPLNTNMSFISELSGSSYQWYLNDVAIPQSDPAYWGETSNTLHLGSNITTDYNGLYYCIVDGVKSRKILVNTREIPVSLKVFLEGGFDGNEMNTTLNSLNLIPQDQPYNSAPWNYSGEESAGVIPADAVDWVLIELYDTTEAEYISSGCKIATQAAFLLSDGTVVSTDGTTTLNFTGDVEDSLFAVIRHRNHLSVLSANALQTTSGVYFYDFTTAADKAYHSEQKTVNGIAVMYGGDANADGNINENDGIDNWYPEVGHAGYLPSDANLDGQSDNKDKNDIWVENNGAYSTVPN